MTNELQGNIHQKYAEAVTMYVNTELPMREVAERCGVTAGSLGNYLRRYRRELVLQRHGISLDGKSPDAICIRTEGKQSRQAHEKYKEAVAACDNLEYIEMNISQIAREYKVNAAGLANFMRVYYSEILERREKVRMRMGINDNLRRGMRPESAKQYADAVEMYRTTDLTLPEIAEICKVSERGFAQYLRFYRRDVLMHKKTERQQAQTMPEKKRGALSGNGRKHKPSSKTEAKYAEALSLFRETALGQSEIARRAGVSFEGFRFYLNTWHKELVQDRREKLKKSKK